MITYRKGNLLDVKAGLIAHGVNCRGVTATEIGDIFYYDETSPTGLRWKVDRFSGKYRNIRSATKGDVAGSLDCRKEGFVTRFRGKAIKVHHVILLLHGVVVPENHVVDHIDGNPENNRFENLRVVTTTLNSRNKAKQVNNKSGVTGVFMWKDHRGSVFWKARVIDHGGRRKEKSFSVRKYGYAGAYTHACNVRKEWLNGLVDDGLGYTSRHGV